MSNQILDDLSTRYTTKKYDSSKRVSAEDIETITEVLRLSASSVNSQPWKFIVLESEAAKRRFHATFEKKFQANQPHALSASHIILFAHNPYYSSADYQDVVNAEINAGRLPAEKRDEMLAKGNFFMGLNTDKNGFNGHWTKAQVYLALGNVLHALARMKIDSTPMEGVDSALIGEVFEEELGGYVCEVALAIGYRDADSDYNAGLPKARLPKEKVVCVL